jgi:hypothetical protein
MVVLGEKGTTNMATPTEKNRSLSNFLDGLLPEGVTRQDSIQKDICATCRKPATDFSDDMSRREFCISGMCQACQDAVFADPEE